ncbi:MAG TPA: hypothetical protein DD979_10730 [Gammaproteobacteria bacterium]|jgi:hypothetical protein|nr:hypothetical protein [Gammaproteobacteria bacterium]
MSDKSGGDIFQANQAAQGNASIQGLNSVAAAGAGVQEALGGLATAFGTATQNVAQNQTQGNVAASGSGGHDNVHADTNISA